MRSSLAIAIALTLSGCAELGYTDRVLWRVPSPDRAMVAVCQEIPSFDGPGYDVRLERPDGALVRRLYQIGDGDPCSEIAWSPDGRTLAVLSGHVARIRFVDVEWAIAHPNVRTAYWSWREMDIFEDGHGFRASGVRFVAPLTFELQLCPPRGNCARPDVRRFDVTLPIVTGHVTARAKVPPPPSSATVPRS